MYCSTEQPLCAFTIRQLARYMKIQCLLHYHMLDYDPTTGPDAEDLEMVLIGDEWEGWGYFFTLESKLFRS